MTLIDKYEAPFVRIAAMIGGDEYLKVARSLLKSEDATDEEIASSTGLRINMVRKVLYDLFGKALITGIRVKDEKKGWFVYRWRSRRDEVENFIEGQKKKISEKEERLDSEDNLKMEELEKIKTEKAELQAELNKYKDLSLSVDSP